jgi:hypothetical protein
LNLPFNLLDRLGHFVHQDWTSLRMDRLGDIGVRVLRRMRVMRHRRKSGRRPDQGQASRKS